MIYRLLFGLTLAAFIFMVGALAWAWGYYYQEEEQ